MVENNETSGPSEEIKDDENLLMDFSNAFKSTTRSKKKKQAPKPTQADYDQDPKDEINRDLEDEQLQNEALSEIIEIPRNLTVT